jgi:hypothetical protein
MSEPDPDDHALKNKPRGETKSENKDVAEEGVASPGGKGVAAPGEGEGADLHVRETETR